MARILLLHTNQSYAETLADTVSSRHPEHSVDVVSRVPVVERLQSLIGNPYDLIQTDELIGNGMLAAMGLLLSDVPLVVAIRGWADYTNAHKQYGWLKAATISVRTRLALRRASETIFISETTSQVFREEFPVESFSVIGRPIDTSRYGGGNNINRKTFDLLTVTNLRYREKYRGVLTVLRALPPLFAEHPDLRFRIAGGGQYLDRLRAFLAGYEYEDRISLLGHVDAVEDEFASGDVFVYVSFLDAYPTVVLEAQAAGLPVVGGNAVGVPDAVGDAGTVCDPTPEGVRSALEPILNDADHRQKLASLSREKMKTYNQEVTAAHVGLWERYLDE